MQLNLDINKLVSPISDAMPQGVEIDYTEKFLSLEKELEGKSEQQYGDVIIPEEEPDWRKVLNLSAELLDTGKDFRLVISLIRALTNLHGSEGALVGFILLKDFTQLYWKSGFPVMHFEGEEDLLLRSNALAPLCSNADFIKDFKKITINTKEAGKLSIYRIEKILQSREPKPEEHIPRDKIHKTLINEYEAGNIDLVNIYNIKSIVSELNEFFLENLTVEYHPNFKAILEIIDLILPANNNKNAASMQTEEATDHGETILGSSTKVSTEYNRENIIGMLDSICELLEKHEPANPAPLLIKRARNMIGLDFLSILQDLAPDGLPQAQLIAGTKKN